MIIPTSQNDYAAGFADGYRQGKKDAEPNEQIKWERDTAIQQLADLGYGLGEKPRRDDCISRKAAVDALHTRFRDGFDGDKWWNSTHVLAAIEGLPSAEPVITCDGCRFVSTYDTDFPCCSCVRREKDYYEPER